MYIGVTGQRDKPENAGRHNNKAYADGICTANIGICDPTLLHLPHSAIPQLLLLLRTGFHDGFMGFMCESLEAGLKRYLHFERFA